MAVSVLIIVILMMAVYVYLNTYDYNKLKPLVARTVEDATGRKLSLAGELDVKFGFWPTLVVTDVALANVSWGSQPQMLEIRKLQAQVRLLPLLFKNGSPTRVATNLLVQNFDLGGFLKETGMNDQVQATVDIATYLNSKGDSFHSLMANLDGAFGAVMGEGYLTEYLDMLSVGLSNKVIHFWGRHEDAEQIKCAVIQFDIKSGVATSRAFVFNTRAGLLRGHGDINLDTEKIDFLLVPTPKHPDLSYMTSLRVSGTLMDPRVDPDKGSMAARGSTALSTLVIGPLGLLAPFVHLGAPNAHACDIESIEELGLSEPAAK